MAWWPHGTEGIVGFAGHDLVDGADCGARRAQRRFPAPRRDDGIGVEPIVIALGDRGADHLDISVWMKPLDDGKIGERRLLALQGLERGGRERIVDGAQAVGPLGMTEAGVVEQAGRVSEEERGHEGDRYANRSRRGSLTGVW